MAATNPQKAQTADARWLFGPVPDLVIGCGLGWMLAAAVHASLGEGFQRWVPAGILVLGLSFPHYGATLVRVYERTEERRRYALFAVHASLLLTVVFVGSLHSVLVGSLLLTLYLTWSPWHYAGQNYGIFLMMLRRRGVPVPPLAKRLVYASFFLSFALTALALHGIESDANYVPVSSHGTEYHLIRLVPAAIAGKAIMVVGLAYAASLIGAGVLLLREGRLRDLAPSALLLATQAMWFSVPVIGRYTGWLEGTHYGLAATAYGFLWVAAAHAAQYLWVTSYYARASGAGRSRTLYLGKTAAAGFAIWTLPALLFAPRFAWGGFHDAGLALMIAAAVNIHHFILDGAIWKLRDGRIGRLLLRASEPEAQAAALGPRRLSPLAAGLWTAGALCIGVAVLGFYEREFGFRRALEQKDLARAETALDRLDWIGRDRATMRLSLGRALAQQDRPGPALEQLRQSVELQPSASAWEAIAVLHARGKRWEEAARAYDEASALDPLDAGILYRSGLAWLEAGRADEAEPRLAAAARLAPESDLATLSLERARRATGDAKSPGPTAAP